MKIYSFFLGVVKGLEDTDFFSIFKAYLKKDKKIKDKMSIGAEPTQVLSTN